jgi:hypothetical protein
MLVQLATISHLLLDNLMRSDLLFSEERLLYDAFLIFCFRIDDFFGRTRLINDDAILSETLNRLCMSGSVSKRSDQIRNPSALTTLDVICSWLLSSRTVPSKTI